MKALVTNDDGVRSPGIRALAEMARDVGLEVMVAAPAFNRSGASASLSAVEMEGRFLVAPVNVAPGVEAVAVDAAPAFIVQSATAGAFGERPDVVLSGINYGPNTGHAILHSGTVGAALTATTHGVPALAVSLALRGSDPCWHTAAAVAKSTLQWLIRERPVITVNINVPDVPLDALAGFRAAKLATFGAVQAIVTEVGEGEVAMEYHGVNAEAEQGTDAALLASGFATCTPLEPVCEHSGADLSGLVAEWPSPEHVPA